MGDSGQNSVVAEEDTDLLILMSAFAKHDIDIKMMIPANNNSLKKIFSSKNIQSTIDDMTANLLFSPAIMGFDTTSDLYRREKQPPFKILPKDNSLQQKAIVFLDPHASADDIL